MRAFLFQRALSSSADSPRSPPEFAGVVAANLNETRMREAERLGVALADKMLASGGEPILKEAKAQSAKEMQNRKDEWENSKQASKSKQQPDVVESLKQYETRIDPNAKCPMHSNVSQ